MAGDIPPLERHAIPEMRVIGIVAGPSGYVAMLEMPDGRGYSVREGSIVGRNKGVVRRIDRGSVIVEEALKTRLGELQQRKYTLELRKRRRCLNHEADQRGPWCRVSPGGTYRSWELGWIAGSGRRNEGRPGPDIHENRRKSSIVRLDGTGLGEAKAFFADAQRFVIDVPGAQGVVKAPRIEGKSPVQKIRIGRHAGEASKVRIVLDLRGPSAVEEIARTASSIELRVTRDARSRYAKTGSTAAPVKETLAEAAAVPQAPEKAEGSDTKPAQQQSAEATVTGGEVKAAGQMTADASSVPTEGEKAVPGSSDKGQTASAAKSVGDRRRYLQGVRCA